MQAASKWPEVDGRRQRLLRYQMDYPANCVNSVDQIMGKSNKSIRNLILPHHSVSS